MGYCPLNAIYKVIACHEHVTDLDASLHEGNFSYTPNIPQTK